jgi:hypothetical protein
LPAGNAGGTKTISNDRLLPEDDNRLGMACHEAQILPEASIIVPVLPDFKFQEDSTGRKQGKPERSVDPGAS